jgi:hypothetical protein
MSILLTLILLCSSVDDCLEKADKTYGHASIIYTEHAIIFAIKDLKEDINNIK